MDRLKEIKEISECGFRIGKRLTRFLKSTVRIPQFHSMFILSIPVNFFLEQL